MPTKYTFPCFALDIFEEPEDDLSDILTKEQSHEFKLYREYQKKQQQLEQMNGNDIPAEDFDDDEMEEFSNQMLDRNLSASTGSGDGETYEETRIKDVTQTLLLFESILARCPSQSVRWQFGGQPLWCSTIPEFLPKGWPIRKKNDTNSKLQIISRDQEETDDEDDFDNGSGPVNVSDYIPKCEYCGSSRVFELELMPTLIYQLHASEYTHNDAEDNEGMDFGCVTIYTCINQCRGPQTDGHQKFRYMREYVHVQPPI